MVFRAACPDVEGIADRQGDRLAALVQCDVAREHEAPVGPRARALQGRAGGPLFQDLGERVGDGPEDPERIASPSCRTDLRSAGARCIGTRSPFGHPCPGRRARSRTASIPTTSGCSPWRVRESAMSGVVGRGRGQRCTWDSASVRACACLMATPDASIFAPEDPLESQPAPDQRASPIGAVLARSRSGSTAPDASSTRSTRRSWSSMRST